MAGADWDFIFDGVVGFLTSPLWQLPVVNFIEKNCIVFDPSEENCIPWADVHKEYKTLVEDLLSSYLKDVGISEEQFVQACGAPSVQSRPQMQAILEQIWAAEDFEIFKRMMVQRNIELELQALELINQQQQQHGRKKVTGKNQQPVDKDKDFDSFEDKILEEVIRRSKEEYEALVKERSEPSSEIEKHYAESHEVNVKILKGKAEEKRQEMKKAVADRVNSPNEAKDSGAMTTLKEEAAIIDEMSSSKVRTSSASAAGKSNTPSYEKVETAAEAATSWLLCAKAEAASEKSNKSSLPVTSTDFTEKEDLKRREKYLKEQRNRLLSMKSKEREKQLDTFTACQPQRPTSARTARTAVACVDADQDRPFASDEMDTKRLAIRKALADKLKKEVIYK